jgi:branched-chain amino acid transport system permease protein
MSSLLAFDFWALVLTYAGIMAVFVLGLQLQVGDTGLLNFGHVGFMAIGAYGTGLMVTNGVPLLLAIPLAVLIAAIAGVLIGIPTLRLRGDYFAIVTIAAGEILRIIIMNSQDVTGGTLGLRGASGSWGRRGTWKGVPGWFNDTFGINQKVPLLVLTWLTALIVALFLRHLGKSPWRRALRAVRENEDAASAVGKNVFKLKLQSLGIGAGIAGLSGVLFTLYQTSLYPDNFLPIVTFIGFAILILGGMGSYFGVIVGSIVIGFIIAGARFLDLPIDGDKLAAVQYMVVGLIIMAIMAFRPQGLFGKKEELHLDG